MPSYNWKKPFSLEIYQKYLIYDFHNYSKSRTHLDVLGELLVALLVVVFVLGEFGEELHALLDQVLTDDFKDLALLKHLSGDVERQILRVHDTLDEVWGGKFKLVNI